MKRKLAVKPRYRPGAFGEDTIGIALLSFAHTHQHQWAQTLTGDARVEVVGFWDDDDERAAAASSEHGLKRWTDLAKLLDDKRVAGAAICSTTERHLMLTEECAARGIHVLCEKPVARSLAEARAMKAAVERAGVTYFQSSPQRLIPANYRIAELIRQGTIGRVTHIRKRHGHHYALAGLEREMPWIVDRGAAGGGALLDEGVHETDMLHSLLGDPLAVIAVTGNGGGYAVETSGTAVYEFAAGKTAVLESAWDWPAGGPTTEIYGEQGVIIESMTDRASSTPGQFWPHLAVFRSSEGTWRDTGERFNFESIQTLSPLAFVDALRRGTPPQSTIDDGIAALEMILGAYRSAETGRRVQFPLN